jgi:uncharacterized Tic20 family protein
MVIRFFLILASLFVVGTAATFLFYVSVLSLVTVIAVAIGLIAALVLGYWAGSHSSDGSSQAQTTAKAALGRATFTTGV